MDRREFPTHAAGAALSIADVSARPCPSATARPWAAERRDAEPTDCVIEAQGVKACTRAPAGGQGGLVAQLQEQGVRGQSPSPSWVPLGDARNTFPKYASASGGSISHSGGRTRTHLLQAADIPAGHAVPPAPPRPRQDQPRQHVGFELLELLHRGRTSRRSGTTASASPGPLASTPRDDVLKG